MQIFNLRQVEVENDLAMAYNMILKKSPDSWKYVYTIRRIRRMLVDAQGLSLTKREMNRVADTFAKWAHCQVERSRFFFES